MARTELAVGGATAPHASTRRPPKALVVALPILVACALPFLVQNYQIFQLTQAMVYAIAIVGLNVLVGFNGQISLGHSAFFALGGYVAAILMNSAGWPYWATLPVAGAVCFVAGFLFGLPALRLSGHYLALATLALAIATPQILKWKALEGWTGGYMGVVLTKPAAPFGLPLNADQWLYFVVLAILLLMFAAAANLLRGRIGRAMVAIRDHPIAAAAMGIDTAMVKSTTFAVSALYTGVAGALGAVVVQFVSPDSFSLNLAISLLVGTVVGGATSISGAIYGALFIQFIPNVTDQISKSAPWAIYGIFLIAFMYVMPSGIAGFLARVFRRRT